MAKDIRTLFEKERNITNEKMTEGHQARFLDKLDEALPQHEKPKFNWLKVAASIVIALGMSIATYHYFSVKPSIDEVVNNETEINVKPKNKTLGDISPDLKKVEDYYVANINLELSKVKITPENKELFDGYVAKLEELNEEYNSLSLELTNNGPDELTINALINNLKLRLNLMYRLQKQLKRMNSIEANQS